MNYVRRGLLPVSLFLVSTVFFTGFANGAIPKWEVVYLTAFFCVLLGRIEFDRITIAVFVFLGYAGLSLVWSDDWRTGFLQMQKLLSLACVFFFARFCGGLEGRGDRPGLAAFVSLAAVLLLGFFAPFHGGYGNENLITEAVIALAALVWYPLIAASVAWHITGSGSSSAGQSAVRGRVMPLLVRRSRVRFSPTLAANLGKGLISVGLFLVTVSYLLYNGAKSEFFVLGILAIGYSAYMRWWALSGALIVVSIALLPFVWPSVEARVELLIPTLRMWLDSPILGQGFGSFNYEFPRFQGVSWLPVSIIPNVYAGAAHNDYAQLLAELGIIGVLLVGWVAWLIPWRGPILVILILSLIEFPIQAPVTGFIFALCLGRLASYSSVSQEALSISGLWSGWRGGISEIPWRSLATTRFWPSRRT